MLRLGFKYPLHIAGVLLINAVLLVLTLTLVTLAAFEVDVLRHETISKSEELRVPFNIPLPTFDDPVHLVWLLAALIVLFALIRTLVRFWGATSQAWLVQKVQTKLRQRVYDKLQRLSFRFFDANETGSIINRATGDCNNVATFSEMAMIQITILIMTMVADFIYMYSLNPRLTLVGMAPAPLLLVSAVLFSKIVRPGYVENRKLYDQLILTLSENVQGQYVVKGFSLQMQEIMKFRKRNDAYRDQQRWIFRRVAFYSALTNSLTQWSVIIVLGYGGYLVITAEQAVAAGQPVPNALTVGSLIAFAALLGQFSGQVLAIANMANTLQASLTAAERVREVLEAPLEIESKSDAKPVGEVKGRIEFRNVTFEYRKGEPVLRDVSFTVEPGQCVAILGATGSGKSTMLSLIPRFYDPTEGQILLDGVDVRDLKLDELRRSIGLVFQENFLFSNTIKANIAFGYPTATDEQIRKAAQSAAATEFIDELDKGFDTIIGELGAGLSGGQRQRLAIARAILLEPAILLLDDATAAIDPETEHEIHLAMDQAMAGRTTFVVAHRLSTLRRADFIIVMERGRIVQIGTHDDLMNVVGAYRRAAQVQVVDEESKRIIKAREWSEGSLDSLLLDEDELDSTQEDPSL